MSKSLKYLALLICILLASCTRVNQQNYDKIQPGMTMQQVLQILGEPTHVNAINVAGVSGTSAKWESRDAVIFIQFFNNQVKIKSMNEADVEFNSGKVNTSSKNTHSQNRHTQIDLPVPTDTIDNQNRL